MENPVTQELVGNGGTHLLSWQSGSWSRMSVGLRPACTKYQVLVRSGLSEKTLSQNTWRNTPQFYSKTPMYSQDCGIIINPTSSSTWSWLVFSSLVLWDAISMAFERKQKIIFTFTLEKTHFLFCNELLLFFFILIGVFTLLKVPAVSFYNVGWLSTKDL